MRRRRLRTLEQVRRALAAAVHATEFGTMEVGRARTLVYGLSTLANVIESAREQGELLQRVMKLEEALLARRTAGAAGTWRPPATPPTA